MPSPTLSTFPLGENIRDPIKKSVSNWIAFIHVEVSQSCTVPDLSFFPEPVARYSPFGENSKQLTDSEWSSLIGILRRVTASQIWTCLSSASLATVAISLPRGDKATRATDLSCSSNGRS